jgi:hypothetical protein
MHWLLVLTTVFFAISVFASSVLAQEAPETYEISVHYSMPMPGTIRPATEITSIGMINKSYEIAAILESDNRAISEEPIIPFAMAKISAPLSANLTSWQFMMVSLLLGRSDETDQLIDEAAHRIHELIEEKTLIVEGNRS